MSKNRYMCALCGTEHEDIEKYSACVSKCSAEIKEREERKRMEELKATFQQRIEELRAAEKHVGELRKSLIKDYGYSVVSRHPLVELWMG